MRWLPRLSIAVLVFGIMLGPVLSGAAFFYPPLALALVALAFITGGFSLYVFPRTRTPALQLVIVSVTSTLLMVTMIDTIGNILKPRFLYLRDDEPYLQRWPDMPVLHRYRPNVEIETRTVGDLAAAMRSHEVAEERPFHFVTDAYGFPNQDSDPSVIDLILLGDSFAAGVGTTLEDTWASVFAKRYRLGVYNLSVSSVGPWDEFANLAVEMPRLRTHPETVVIWALFSGNDLEESVYEPYTSAEELPAASVLESWLVRWQNFVIRSPIRRMASFAQANASTSDHVVITRPFADGSPISFWKPYAERVRRSLSYVQQHTNYPALTETFAAMERLGEAHQVRIVVVMIPSKEQVYDWVLEERSPWSPPSRADGFSLALAELSAEHGMCYLDLTPALRAASRQVYEEEGALLYWRDDTHWNPAGHAAAAAALMESPCIDGAPEALTEQP